MKQKYFLLIIVMVMLSTLACGKFTVQNKGPYPVAVKVTLPDSAYAFKTVRNSGSASWTTMDYGDYRVDIIKSEVYVEKIQNIQTRVMDSIFTDIAFEVADPTEMMNLVQILSNTQARLNDLASAGFSSCSGWIPGTTISLNDVDYEEIDTTVVLNYDEASKTWSCSEVNE